MSKRTQVEAPVRTQEFVLAELVSGEQEGGLRVSFAGGASAKLEDPSQVSLLARLIRALS